MLAIECLNCGTIHGWGNHPQVKKVERYHRMPNEDIWYCPGCGREHRTFDGTWFGQSFKMWRKVDDPDKVVQRNPWERKFMLAPDGRLHPFPER